MIFYFTGTGNSLWAAKEIGKELNQPVENIIKQKAIFSAKRYNRFCLSYLHERSAMDCKRIFIEVNGQS